VNDQVDRTWERERDLVLASTSPYRRALLTRLGVPFRCVAPLFEETSIPPLGRSPRELAELLADGKAASVAACEPAATVIGCDQVVALDGNLFSKPHSQSKAIDQLQAMAGRTHELITALVVLDSGRSFRHTDVTRMRMRPLSTAEIERYVTHDQPLDCAGSYKLEERGILLFKTIETEDHTAITGLPLIALTTILRELGFTIP
jgi:septum formation protein